MGLVYLPGRITMTRFSDIFSGRRIAACCIGIILALVAGCSSSSSAPRKFQHEIPESVSSMDTNVSAAQAFMDNSIKIPKKASSLKYDANESDNYGNLVCAGESDARTR